MGVWMVLKEKYSFNFIQKIEKIEFTLGLIIAEGVSVFIWWEIKNNLIRFVLKREQKVLINIKEEHDGVS